jgi:ketosteroid isomerase-like protein
MMRTTIDRAPWIIGILTMGTAGMFMIHSAMAAVGPTKENALASEKELAQAMRTNNADGVCRLLDEDWAVVDGNGGLNDRKNVCAAIKAGTFVRTTYEPDLANARVRVYDDIATITFHLSLSGPFEHKTFSGNEIETDILRWKDGGWKCVLTHETNVAGTLVIK